MKKGVSSVIISVLLISIGLVLVLIVYNLTTSTLKQKSSEMENRTSEFIEGISSMQETLPPPPSEPNDTTGNNWCNGSDINRDHHANHEDYVTLKAVMQAGTGQNCSELNVWCSLVDINRDGEVNSEDLAVWIQWSAMGVYCDETASVLEIPGWYSAVEHGAYSPGEKVLEISEDGKFVEPRKGGVRKIIINFSEEINPATFTRNSVLIAGNNASNYSISFSGINITVSVSADGKTGTIYFEPALQNGKYIMKLEDVNNATGALLTKNVTRRFAVLTADANSDLRVNVLDLSYMWGNQILRLNQNSSASHIRSDANIDGRVNILDLSFAWGRNKDDLRYVGWPDFGNENSQELFDETIEVYVSETPSNILALYKPYGPHQANLTLVGVSQTNPSFNITARVSFDSSKDKQWAISGVSCSNIPVGFTCPAVLKDSSDTYYYENVSTEYVAVKSGGNDKYKMVWFITGDATENIGPVLLPRFETRPWIGYKRGMVIKGRDNMSFNPNDAPYGENNVNLYAFFNPFVSAIENMSNKRVVMNYTIKEAYHEWIGDDVNMKQHTSAFLDNLSINKDNYKNYYEWVVPTLYDSAFESESKIPQGMESTVECPQCGPGTWEPKINWQWTIKAVLLHEFGHGVGRFGHPRMNYYCVNSTADNVQVKDIFFDCEGNADSFYDTADSMYGDGLYWWNPLYRARLGWLNSSQVKLVTESGIYEVYSDNEDLTSDPSKPLILQLIATTCDSKLKNGMFIPDCSKIYDDFVHIIVPNKEIVMKIPYTGANLSRFSNGILLGAARADMRRGLSRATTSFISYGYNNTNTPSARYEGTIPVEAEVHLNWTGTNVKIKLLEKSGNHARVQITYGPA